MYNIKRGDTINPHCHLSVSRGITENGSNLVAKSIFVLNSLWKHKNRILKKREEKYGGSAYSIFHMTQEKIFNNHLRMTTWTQKAENKVRLSYIYTKCTLLTVSKSTIQWQRWATVLHHPIPGSVNFMKPITIMKTLNQRVWASISWHFIHKILLILVPFKLQTK